MKKISSFKVVSTDGLAETERVNEQLKALIFSVKGTIPGSRNFGLEREFISRPPREAVNIFAIDLEEKVQEFIPDISIANVEGDFHSDGSVDLTIYVERRV